MEQATVLATGLCFPEGPVFDLSERLWCAEHTGGGLFCLDPDGRTERLATGGHPTGLALDKQGNIWFCDASQHAIRRFNPDNHRVETIVNHFNGKPLERPKDLIFDQSDNLIFTCSGLSSAELGNHSMQGYVLALTVNGTLQIIADELDCPSGLAFIPGTDTLLIAETQKQRIWSGFWDGTSPSWDTIDVWTNTGHVAHGAYGPDGITVGPDGNIYAAIYGAGLIQVYDPDGQFIRDIELPGSQPTNCIFDLTGEFLIVSEAEHGELLQIRV